MHKTFFAAILVNLTFFALLSTGALAQTNDSVYTKLDLDNECSIIQADDFGATLACPGYRGYPVMVAEGDLRMFVSYGLDSLNERAAEQTLSAFNTIGETLEWRLANRATGWTPIATILRFFTEDGMGDKQQYLIVTKVKLGETCQVARINASKYKNANQIARDVADTMAEGFNCANEPIVWAE
ncbi:hypothetical protein [Maritalea sp.]|jgi:hypothetical protein|uniref:hypothetical protein n=1 Tax=Maritalea sp. TaxID=2003361 RepID=UPI0039E53E29